LDYKIKINKMEDATKTNQELLNDLYSQRDTLNQAVESNPTKFYNMQQLKKGIIKKDMSTANVLEEYSKQAYNTGSLNNPDDNIPFEIDRHRDLIRHNVVQKGNLESIKYDEMIPGRVFYDDLVESIQGGTYADLGVTDDQLVNADMNADGVIDEQEAMTIADAMMEDEDTSKEYITNYFLLHMQKNYNNGVQKNRKPLKQLQKENEPNATSNMEEKKEYIPKSIKYEKGSL